MLDFIAKAILVLSIVFAGLALFYAAIGVALFLIHTF